ncbi:MAG TPA: hypothetical protein VD793_09275 [Gemmatimonadales bacterium]|nr:hypothetical protein [Gemmatimonadales bacterium]
MALAWAAPVTAQVTVSGAALVGSVEHRVDAGFGVETNSGVVAGGMASVTFGRVGVTAAAHSGTLKAGLGATQDLELAEGALHGTARVLDWLWLEAGVRWRAYVAPVGRQRWSLAEVGTLGRLPFAVPGLAALGRVMLQPTVRVSGGLNPDPSLRGAVGLEYARGPLQGQLLYGRERHEFPSLGGFQRLEQLSAVTFRLSLQLARGS